MTLSEAIMTRLNSIIKVRELRRRVTYTLLMFLIARIGVHIACLLYTSDAADE